MILVLDGSGSFCKFGNANGQGFGRVLKRIAQVSRKDLIPDGWRVVGNSWCGIDQG
jgi:hypothetical protein